MTQIVVDAATAAQFLTAPPGTPVLGPNGMVLGTFVPESAIPAPPYGIECPYTKEELDEFEKQPGRTLDEIWKSLGRK